MSAENKPALKKRRKERCDKKKKVVIPVVGDALHVNVVIPVVGDALQANVVDLPQLAG